MCDARIRACRNLRPTDCLRLSGAGGDGAKIREGHGKSFAGSLDITHSKQRVLFASGWTAVPDVPAEFEDALDPSSVDGMGCGSCFSCINLGCTEGAAVVAPMVQLTRALRHRRQGLLGDMKSRLQRNLWLRQRSQA